MCFAYDDALRRGGHFLGGEALPSAKNAVTLRIKNGSLEVTDGPYAETKEMLGGILFLEARDLNHAISLMSRHPGVKGGPFEIRLADVATNERIAARDVAMAEALRDDPQFQTIGELFLFIAMHEMSHRSQLADARKVLGRKPFA